MKRYERERIKIEKQGSPQKIGSKKSVLEWRSAKTIRRAPDKIGNVNKSIPPVIKRAQGNNGIVFNVR